MLQLENLPTSPTVMIIRYNSKFCENLVGSSPCAALNSSGPAMFLELLHLIIDVAKEVFTKSDNEFQISFYGEQLTKSQSQVPKSL